MIFLYCYSILLCSTPRLLYVAHLYFQLSGGEKGRLKEALRSELGLS